MVFNIFIMALVIHTTNIHASALVRLFKTRSTRVGLARCKVSKMPRRNAATNSPEKGPGIDYPKFPNAIIEGTTGGTMGVGTVLGCYWACWGTGFVVGELVFDQGTRIGRLARTVGLGGGIVLGFPVSAMTGGPAGVAAYTAILASALAVEKNRLAKYDYDHTKTWYEKLIWNEINKS
jgi:hypothetical protein